MIRRFLISILAVALFACAAPININTDYDTAADFSSMQTYAWRAPNDFNRSSERYLADDLTDQRIRKTVDEQLSSKGYRLQQEVVADFMVNYSVTVEEKSSLNSYNTYGGYGPGFNYGGVIGTGGTGISIGYISGPDLAERVYREGTLIIDVLGPQSDKLIWRGAADGRLPKEQNRADRDKMIREAVTGILEKFPPESK